MLVFRRCISEGPLTKWTENTLFSPEGLQSLKNGGAQMKDPLNPRKANKVDVSKNSPKQYSVLIPFVSPNGKDEELHLLYTKRTPFLRSHPREICFPGGKVEENESIVRAALRETREELHIPEEAVEVITSLQPVPNREGNGLITPVLGLVSSLSTLRPNAEEVERIISVPLSELLNASTSGYTQFRSPGSKGYSLPAFRITSIDRIWGMTAIMTHMALSKVLRKEYSGRIRFVNPV